MMIEFCHLHVHDEYSLLDGFGSPEKFVQAAKDAGQQYLAITNHGNIDSALKFQSACGAAGITPVFGCELYVVEDLSKKERGEKRSHLTVLVKNEDGWLKLMKLLGVAHNEGFFYRPRVDAKTLLEHSSEGLIYMTACSSSLIHKEWGVGLLKKLFNKNCMVYSEIMPHKYDEQEKTNTLAIELANKYNWGIVATNDCHYPKNDDSVLQEILLAIQSKKKWTDPDRWKFSVDGLYVKTAKEMLQSFIEIGIDKRTATAAIERSVQIAKDCSAFKIERKKVDLPYPPLAVGKDPDKVLKDLCKKSFKKKLSNGVIPKEKEKEYTDRLNEELTIIFRQGFSLYFLIVEELVRWCKENDIMVGPGRGSSAGSIVCWLTGITVSDPIKYGLLFARFISPARIDFPDIDMDFEDRKRHLIYNHFCDLYGEKSIAGISTFSAMGGKGVIRDVSRVFNVPMVDVNAACKSIVVRSGGDARADFSVTDAFETFEDGKKFRKKYPEVSEYAIKMEGTVRGKGQHAAGTIVSADDLTDSSKCYLVKGKDGKHLLNWDKHEIDHMGLMKLDILGLNALTVLSESLSLIKSNHNIDIDLESIPLDDEETLNNFTEGNSVGVFQFGSPSFRRYCKQLVIESFDDVVNATSLWRPGTLRSGMVTEFCLRKNGQTEIPEQHQFIRKITQNTYGIILYQEQVMQFMYELGGLGWKTCDTVRKTISKSEGVDKFMSFKKMFADGCVERKTLDRETAEKLWDELANFGSYGFNLSHAVSYSIISYWDMWFKTHYTIEFFAASLTYCGDDKKESLVQDAMKNGIDLRLPKIGISDWERWIIRDNKLYCPFIEMKGIGPKTASVLSSKRIKTREDVKKWLPRFSKVFEECRCYDDEPLSQESSENAEKYFGISFSSDKAYRFKRLKEIISFQENFDTVVSEENFYKDKRIFVGVMETVKFGYRQKIEKSSSGYVESKGLQDDMGGVYGNFADSSGENMIVFSSDVYLSKKSQTEHCADKILFLVASKPSKSKQGNLHCHYFWDEDDISSAKLEKCNIDFLSLTGGKIVILIETRPRKDDTAFEYIVDEILSFAKKYKLSENIEFLFLAKDGKVNKKSFDDRISKIDPILIFAFGSKVLQTIEKEKLSISDLTGTTTWSKDRQCWICWSVSQASMYYSDENKKTINEAIENFKRTLKSISGKNAK